MDKQLFKKIAGEIAGEQMVPNADRGMAIGFALECAKRYEKTLVSEKQMRKVIVSNAAKTNNESDWG